MLWRVRHDAFREAAIADHVARAVPRTVWWCALCFCERVRAVDEQKQNGVCCVYLSLYSFFSSFLLSSLFSFSSFLFFPFLPFLLFHSLSFFSLFLLSLSFFPPSPPPLCSSPLLTLQPPLHCTPPWVAAPHSPTPLTRLAAQTERPSVAPHPHRP